MHCITGMDGKNSCQLKMSLWSDCVSHNEPGALREGVSPYVRLVSLASSRKRKPGGQVFLSRARLAQPLLIFSGMDIA